MIQLFGKEVRVKKQPGMSLKYATRAPRGTDGSSEYNEHFCYKLDSRVKKLTTEWNQNNITS